MRIALVFPRSTFLSSSDVWPPLGLFYLSSQLEAQGHETEFFDLNMQELPKDGEFDQLWISSTSPQIADVRRIGEITRKWTKTRTVLGGAGVWANLDSHRELPFNLFVVGEADHPETIKNILVYAGMCWRMVYRTEISKNLDWVLPPNRRWTRRYHSYMDDKDGNSYRMASIFTTRGCPMSCAFCESGRLGVIWGNQTRYEPLDVVEAQIANCFNNGFTGLAYYDDIFIVNKPRTLKLLELHNKYDMKFRCFLRSDILIKHGGKEYLKQLQDGGLIEVFVGVESADNQIKANINKGTTIEQDTQVLAWCKELGITCKMSLILGLPGETKESLLKTYDWILENRPDRVQVDRLVPFKGTPLTDHPEDYDLTYENQPDDEWFFKGRMDLDSHSFVSTSGLTVDEIDTFWIEMEETLRKEGIGA